MKIVAAKYYQAQIPFKNPIVTSYARLEQKNFDILVLTDELGNQGYGELSALSHPDYLSEFLVQERYVLQKYLLNQVLEKQDFNFDWVQGHFFAKATLDQCLWDLRAKRQKVALSCLFTKQRDKLELGVSLGMFANKEELLKHVYEFYQQGYRRFKFKLSPQYPKQWLLAVREKFSDVVLLADANGSFSSQQDKLLNYDDIGLSLIEQPFTRTDFLSHAKFQAKMQTPICLDESILTLDDLKVAQALGSCRAVNLKIGRVGGITQALRLNAYCQENNLLTWVGGMYETGVGRAFNWHFSTQTTPGLPGDLTPPQSYLKDDIIQENFDITNGQLKLPCAIGCGVSLDLAKLNYYSYKINEKVTS